MTEEQKKNRKLKLKKRDTERYAYRKEHSLCVACGKNEVEHGTALCDQCKQKRRKTMKEDRLFYQSIGICPVCKTNKICDFRKQCPACNEQARKYLQTDSQKSRRKLIYRQRKEQGMCVSCGKRLAETGKVLCTECRLEHELSQRKRYLKSRVDGIRH